MSYKMVRRIPEPEEIVSSLSLSPQMQRVKSERDSQIREIIEGKSDKFLVIIGPCSADDEAAALDYVNRLTKVQEKVKDRLLLIPRIYTNKPRTNGMGYKGMLHQPDPSKEPNMVDGIMAIRKMFIAVISETGLTPADEMLYPSNLPYCEDLLSYIAIGARSVENQQHRLVSSGISLPVGMKNPTSGDMQVMFNAIQAAQHPHNFSMGSYECESTGNPLAHVIMRGSVNKHGECIPNYHYEDLSLAAELYEKRGLVNPAIIVDVNHDNSKKRYKEQIRISKEILHSRRHNTVIGNIVRGLMIESYIEEGNQPVGGGVYGKSITDPCLNWHDSEELLYYIAENLN